MKKGIINIILLIFFFMLIGLYIMIVKKPFQDTKDIFSVKEDSITGISISSKNGEIVFVKKNNQWIMIKPDKYKINEKGVSELENILNNLSLERVIEKDAVDLSIYSLDKPAMIISLELEDGREESLLVGGETASKSQYYASKQSETKKVFTVSRGFIDVFNRDISDFRDRALFSVDLSILNEFRLINNLNNEIKIIKSTEIESKWKLVLPVYADVKNDTFVEIINNLRQLEIIEYISANPDELGKYGLKKPFYRLIIKDKDGYSQEISFGKDLGNKTFVKSNEAGEIYTIASNLFNPEEVALGELLNIAPLSLGIDSITEVVISSGVNSHSFKRDISKTGDVFDLNGKEVETEKFISLYVSIMALSAEGYDNKKYMTKPDFTIILKSKESSEEVKVDFTKRGKDSYFIILNESQMPFYLGAKKIEIVKSFLNRIVESEKS